MERTTQEWLARLVGRVPCAPVNSVEEALQEQQILERDMLAEVVHPNFGTLRQVRTAIKIPGAATHQRPAPALGADTAPILKSVLHYSDEQIALLRTSRAI